MSVALKDQVEAALQEFRGERIADLLAEVDRERLDNLSRAERAEKALAAEERANIRTLEERDALQDLFDELYVAFFGEGPEYSNLFSATDAFNEMDARLSGLKARAARAEKERDALREALVEAENLIAFFVTDKSGVLQQVRAALAQTGGENETD